jgi:hypothetical protein
MVEMRLRFGGNGITITTLLDGSYQESETVAYHSNRVREHIAYWTGTGHTVTVAYW